MAEPNTQRQGRSTSKAPKFHILGMTLDQKELIIAVYCAFFFCVAIIGMIAGGLGGKEETPKEPPAEPPTTQGEGDDQPAEPEPEPFKLSQTSASLDPGGSVTLSVTGALGEVSWATSNNKVVTVAGGVVTAVAGGSATVTATSGEDSAVCIVTVSGAPYVSTLNLYLNKTDFTFGPGSAPVQMHLKLKETRADYDGEIVWASADPQIAKISETGLVEWVGKGTTTVTATVDGLVFECIVRAVK